MTCFTSTILLGKLGIDFSFFPHQTQLLGRRSYIFLSSLSENISMPTLQYPSTQVHSHRSTNATSWECWERKSKPDCTLGLYKKYLATWKGLNRVYPNPSTSHPSLKFGTNSCTPSLAPEIHTVSHKTTFLCLHSRKQWISSAQRFWKQRPESEVFTTKTLPGLTPQRLHLGKKRPHQSLTEHG